MSMTLASEKVIYLLWCNDYGCSDFLQTCNEWDPENHLLKSRMMLMRVPLENWSTILTYNYFLIQKLTENKTLTAHKLTGYMSTIPNRISKEGKEFINNWLSMLAQMDNNIRKNTMTWQSLSSCITQNSQPMESNLDLTNSKMTWESTIMGVDKIT